MRPILLLLAVVAALAVASPGEAGRPPGMPICSDLEALPLYVLACYLGDEDGMEFLVYPAGSPGWNVRWFGIDRSGGPNEFFAEGRARNGRFSALTQLGVDLNDSS